MNPITALMLSRAIEQDRRRELDRRLRRHLANQVRRSTRAGSASPIRRLRLGLAGTKA